MAKQTDEVNKRLQEAKKDISKLLAWQAKLSVTKFNNILSEKLAVESSDKIVNISERKDKFQM